MCVVCACELLFIVVYVVCGLLKSCVAFIVRCGCLFGCGCVLYVVVC